MRFWSRRLAKSGLIVGTVVSVIACIEDSFSTNLDHSNIVLHDTLTTDLILKTYQSPPRIGAQQYLYLGSNGEFEIPYTLLKLGSLSALQDSVTYLSGYFQLTLVSPDTNLDDEEIPLSLAYFDLDSSYGFSESSTNFANDTLIREAVPSGFLSQLPTYIDTLGQHIRFAVDTSLLRSWADTSATEQLFKLEAEEPLGEIIKFYSSESSSNWPVLKVTYEDSVLVDSVMTLDTLETTIAVVADVSILVPPLASEGQFDSSFVYLGSGAGLKTLILADIDTLHIPTEAVVVRANLVLTNEPDPSSTAGGAFKAKVSLLKDTTEDWLAWEWGRFIQVDTLSFTTFQVATLNSESLELTQTVDRLVESIVLGNRENFGFKLETSSSGSIFDYVAFHTSSSVSEEKWPKLEILYAVP